MLRLSIRPGQAHLVEIPGVRFQVGENDLRRVAARILLLSAKGPVDQAGHAAILILGAIRRLEFTL